MDTVEEVVFAVAEETTVLQAIEMEEEPNISTQATEAEENALVREAAAQVEAAVAEVCGTADAPVLEQLIEHLDLQGLQWVQTETVETQAEEATVEVPAAQPALRRSDRKPAASASAAAPAPQALMQVETTQD